MKVCSVFIDVRRPAHALEVPFNFDVSKVRSIGGASVLANDTPCCSFADVLVNRVTSEFVGLTFDVNDDEYIEKMRLAVETFDPEIVRFAPDGALSLEGRHSGVPAVNIMWARSEDPRYVFANLVNGQWFWWYDRSAFSRPAIDMSSLVAVSCSWIDNVCDELCLKWPGRLRQPRLAVDNVVPE